MRDIDDEAGLDDNEYPDEPEDEDDDETVACPYCRQAVYEDAERCPGCGSYLSREDAPRRARWWIVIGVVLVLAAWFWVGR